MDERGYFVLRARKKDLIIAGGYKIYPSEIEETLQPHPKVLEVAAVGIPHPYRGETVKVFIVPKPGQTITEQEIIAWCKERLAKYKVPTAVELRTELPKTAIGKVLRRKLVERPPAPKAGESAAPVA
jgi:long-chain acyl-CoA synthetase